MTYYIIWSLLTTFLFPYMNKSLTAKGQCLSCWLAAVAHMDVSYLRSKATRSAFCDWFVTVSWFDHLNQRAYQ